MPHVSPTWDVMSPFVFSSLIASVSLFTSSFNLEAYALYLLLRNSSLALYITLMAYCGHWVCFPLFKPPLNNTL